jgi:tetratricopeptide (TPR) repeat protein
MISRGNASYAKDGDDRAIGDYSQAIQLDPTNSRAYRNRGGAYYLKRDYRRAIADFGEAIRLDPNDASAYTARANAYNATGEIDRADVDFNQAKLLAAQPRKGRKQPPLILMTDRVCRNPGLLAFGTPFVVLLTTRGAGMATGANPTAATVEPKIGRGRRSASLADPTHTPFEYAYSAAATRMSASSRSTRSPSSPSHFCKRSR